MKCATSSEQQSPKGKAKQEFAGGNISRDKLKAHEQELLSNLKEAHSLGKHKLAAYHQHQYLNSFAARYIATETAYKKLKKNQRPPKSSLLEIAEGLDAFRGTDEKVEVYWKPKKSNRFDFRPIMKFGIRNKALQYLVLACLKAQANLHTMQFATNHGRQRAVKQTVQYMQEGYDHITEMDIINCFQSFDEENLTRTLALPKEVIEHVILSTHFNLYPIDVEGQSWDCLEDMFDFYSEDLTEARRGIAQGSATSSVVAEILLSFAIERLPAFGAVLTYADNFLLLTKSNEEAVAMRKALRCVLQAHPAGPLQLKEPKIYGSGQAVEFLGYALSVGKMKTKIEPTLESLHRFKSVFKRKLRKISVAAVAEQPHEKVVKVKALKAFVTNWTNAFILWPNAKLHRETHIAIIEKLAPS
jgi:hypothetical protein